MHDHSPALRVHLASLIDWWDQMGAPTDAEDRARFMPVPASDSAPVSAAAPVIRSSPAIDRTGANGARSLDELRAMLEALDGGELKQAARSLVFGEGAPGGVMIVGEAPGADEDRAGRPFVGRSGKLLDKMLAAIGLDRQTNVRITNLLPWRPPTNRDPREEEIALCAPFLRRHIALAEPKLLVTTGRFAMQFLLAPDEGIMRMRGRVVTYQHGDVGPIPAIPILHPAYLLRRPAEKARAWRDMLIIEQEARKTGISLRPVI